MLAIKHKNKIMNIKLNEILIKEIVKSYVDNNIEHFMKKYDFIFLTIFSKIQLFSTFGGGVGTLSVSYQILNKEHLLGLLDSVYNRLNFNNLNLCTFYKNIN